MFERGDGLEGESQSHLRKRSDSAAFALSIAAESAGRWAPGLGLKWSQKFAASLLRSSSAVGSLQCLA